MEVASSRNGLPPDQKNDFVVEIVGEAGGLLLIVPFVKAKQTDTGLLPEKLSLIEANWASYLPTIPMIPH